MTQPEHKISVHDDADKDYPFREKNFSSKKPFVFKGYRNELDRIKETLKRNKYLFNYPDSMDNIKTNTTEIKKEDSYNFDIPNPNSNTINAGNYHRRSSLFKPDQKKDLIKKKVIIQPQMRFSARTDLERVFDAINEKSIRKKEKNILRRQLKHINLYNSQNPSSILKKINDNVPFKTVEEEINEYKSLDEEKRGYKIKPNPFINNVEEKVESNEIYGDGNLFYIPTKQIAKPWQKKLDLNLEAEKMLSELHKKTHFKAAEEVAEKKIDYKQIRTSNNSFSINNKLKKINERKIFSFDEKDDYNYNNFENYNLNKNPFDLKRNDFVDPDSLKALSKIAFKDSIIKGDAPIPENHNEHEKNKDYYYHKRKLVDENNVLIDGQILYKDSQFDVIANRVLKACNVYKKKSKHNDTNLKKGKGKLMMTKGLSVSQFEKKYNFSD